IIVERGEDRLLHLAGVVGAADQDNALGKVDRDDGLGAHAVALGISLERRQAQNGEIGDVVGELGALGTDQQRADEQRVPGELGIDPRLDAVFGVGAAVEVLGVELLASGVLEEVAEQQVELGGRQLAVLLPPDRLLGGFVADDELVLGAAAGVDAGFGAERAALDDRALAVRNRVLVKRSLQQIPMDRREILEAEFVSAVGAVPQTRFLHD